MKIILDLEKVKGQFVEKGQIRVRFKIDDDIIIHTQLASLSRGSYCFMQKHILSITKLESIKYIQITIMNKYKGDLAHITVFQNKFKQHNHIEIKNGQSKYTLYYTLNQLKQNQTIQNKLSKVADQKQNDDSQNVQTNADDQANFSQYNKKPEFHKVIKLVYLLLLRLDCLVYAFEVFQAIILWKKPYQTLIVTVALTIIVYNLKITICLGGLFLYFFKKTLITKISTLDRYNNHHTDLRFPEKNAMFLQVNMERYCNLYDKIAQNLFTQDKSVMINVIKLLCKAGIVLVLLMFAFGIQHCIVIIIWSILILTSPFKELVTRNCKPIGLFLMGEYFKVFNKVEERIFNVIGKSSRRIINNDQIIKQFYFYSYERWWIFEGWTDEYIKYSDSQYFHVLEPRSMAPHRWRWIEEWKIDFSGDVDSHGFQYSNDLLKQFSSNQNILSTVRRRKWKRQCIKLSQNIEIQ